MIPLCTVNLSYSLLERGSRMKRSVISLILVLVLSFVFVGCKKSNKSSLSETSAPTIQKKQYITTHTEENTFKWQCDIAPSDIKDYTGSPIEGFFITNNGELYEYDVVKTFSETEKCYRKIETNLKIKHMYYHFQFNRFSVLTEDFKVYSYNPEDKTFTNINTEFESVLKVFDSQGQIISWTNTNFNTSFFWFIDHTGNVYTVDQTEGKKYEKTFKCTLPFKEEIISANVGVIKTQKGYYLFNSKENRYKLSTEATAAYDNIAFLNELLVMYKDDPSYVYDHRLVYTVTMDYYC